MFNIHKYPKLKKFINNIYKKTFRELYILIIKSKIASRSDFLVKKILKDIQKKKKFKILFNSHEYQTLDLLSIYSGIGLAFKKKGFKIENISYELLPIADNIKSKKFFPKNKITEYEMSIKNLKLSCKKYKINDLFYPILDTIHKYHYRIWQNSFNGCFKFNSKIFELILDFRKKFSLIANKSDLIFLPDSAYIHNQIIKQEFLKKGKKVIILSPSAGYFDCKNFYDSEASGLKSKTNLIKYKKHKTKIEKFIQNRFYGGQNTDHYNFAYKSIYKKKIISKKIKILYLHSFTDSNNQSWKYNQPFVNHLEWTEYTLKNLSKINFKNWYLKIHPASKYSVDKNTAFNNQAFGNDQILKYFIKKYKIPNSVFKDCPSGIEILENKIPIYTNSSSIVFETLIFGYKTIFSGSKFDPNFGIRAETKNKWKKLLFQNKNKISHKVEEKIKNQAKYLMWEISTRNEITNISPDGWVYSWDGKYEEFKLAFKFFFKMMNSKNNI